MLVQLRIRSFAQELLWSKHHGAPDARIGNVRYDLLREERLLKLYQLLGADERCNRWSDNCCTSTADACLGTHYFTSQLPLLVGCRAVSVTCDRSLQTLQVEHSHLLQLRIIVLD